MNSFLPFQGNSMDYFNKNTWIQNINVRISKATEDFICIGFIYYIPNEKQEVLISNHRLNLLFRLTDSEKIKEYWESKIKDISELTNLSYIDMMYLYDSNKDFDFFFSQPKCMYAWRSEEVMRYYENYYSKKLFNNHSIDL